MPELPEVETARSLIADQALHRRIVDVDDSDSYVVRPHSPGELRGALTGRSLTAAHRRGKTMWLETSGTGGAAGGRARRLGIHLGMSGRIVVTGPDGTRGRGRRSAPLRHLAAQPGWNRFTLSSPTAAVWCCLTRAAWAGSGSIPTSARSGQTPRRSRRTQFRALITKGTIAVKARLLDQSKMAGVGNLLADEILWQAKVSPLARVNSLTPGRSIASTGR